MEEMSSHPEPSRTMNRRRLLCSGLKAGCAPFLISRFSSAQQIRNDSPRSGEALKIADLEFIELTGHIDLEAGVNEQYQVNPLDVYEALRRPPYKDVPGGTRRRAIKSIYLQLKTAEGVNGIYGPIDRDVA
jgi:L-rhamnonate dehydratase